tara:strand:+ start:709 stop:999 length:291 start_codon:yes stop_codon:yes gene_type:complete
MNKKIFFSFFFFFGSSLSSDLQTMIISENCKGCHGYDYKGNEYLVSLMDISRSDFIYKMKIYQKSKDNSVMNRIAKVLTNEDIKKIANYIYEDEKE